MHGGEWLCGPVGRCLLLEEIYVFSVCEVGTSLEIYLLGCWLYLVSLGCCGVWSAGCLAAHRQAAGRQAALKCNMLHVRHMCCMCRRWKAGWEVLCGLIFRPAFQDYPPKPMAKSQQRWGISLSKT